MEKNEIKKVEKKVSPELQQFTKELANLALKAVEGTLEALINLVKTYERK